MDFYATGCLKVYQSLAGNEQLREKGFEMPGNDDCWSAIWEGVGVEKGLLWVYWRHLLDLKHYESTSFPPLFQRFSLKLFHIVVILPFS